MQPIIDKLDSKPPVTERGNWIFLSTRNVADRRDNPINVFFTGDKLKKIGDAADR